jgi:hypothetical protein
MPGADERKQLSPADNTLTKSDAKGVAEILKKIRKPSVIIDKKRVGGLAGATA